ncbi:hypothetical protein [Pimelobacter simplex]|uniref:hypothetical protein n=1 Tax=Nocardioides simplex TaxID=2045 RepID=UPI003AADA8D1
MDLQEHLALAVGDDPHPVADRPETELLGVMAPVRAPDWATLLVTHGGIRLVGITMGDRFGQVLRGGTTGAAVTRGGQAMLRRVLAVPVEQLRGTFIAWDDIVSARAVARDVRASTVVLHLSSGRRRKLRIDPEAVYDGDPWGAVADRLGERWQVAD